ncbi:hypothetical protein GCM10027174_19420 [Salinifilum aidingensis]
MTARTGARRPRARSGAELLLVGTLLVLAGLAWLLTSDLAAPGMRLGILTGARPVRSHGAEGIRFGLFLVTWVVMMAAMMLPAITPFTVGIGRVMRARRAGTGTVAALTTGYLLAWGTTGLVAYLLLRGFDAVAAAGGTTAVRAGAVVLLVAGAFQFTRFKQWCLVHCRSPMALLVQHGERATRSRGGALLVGSGHGAYCIGCCWALMLVLLAAGMMSLVWMAGVAALVTLEKVLPRGQLVSFAIGALLIGAAVVLLAAPGLVSAAS